MKGFKRVRFLSLISNTHGSSTTAPVVSQRSSFLTPNGLDLGKVLHISTHMHGTFSVSELHSTRYCSRRVHQYMYDHRALLNRSMCLLYRTARIRGRVHRSLGGSAVGWRIKRAQIVRAHTASAAVALLWHKRGGCSGSCDGS